MHQHKLIQFLFFISVYVILGHYYEHIGLMMSLQMKGLLENGIKYNHKTCHHVSTILYNIMIYLIIFR